ncbi:hypothetical protein B0J14DRAFT_367603 [Halenospora varia]|nr:hypothetical protein B0J14DRAFT_367603 [Halenospora varia]
MFIFVAISVFAFIVIVLLAILKGNCRFLCSIGHWKHANICIQILLVVFILFVPYLHQAAQFVLADVLVFGGFIVSGAIIAQVRFTNITSEAFELLLLALVSLEDKLSIC